MDLSAILNNVQDDEARQGGGKGEAGTGRTTDTNQSQARLLCLPAELYDPIISYLSNQDIKSLRLTCTFLHSVARLRLSRVFISANQRDIQVLQAIANSEEFRLGVTELIWDDARFGHDVDDEDADSEADDEGGDDEHVPQWFQDAYDDNIDELNSRKGLDADGPEHLARAQQLNARLPSAVCWANYQKLLREQDALLTSGADEAAFRHALQRFPSLKRVTITPAAHGWLFCPLYETPTIRVLPHGFNYPIPRGWPTTPDGDPPRRMTPWPADGDGEAYKEQWHGIRVALRVLADPEVDHSITELILDAHSLDTGLNCRIFEGPSTASPAAPPNREYALLCALLRRPGFAHLDLALAVGGQEHLGWPALRGAPHLLRAALAGAEGMRHFGLRTNVIPDPDARATEPGSGGCAEHHVPLAGLVPVAAGAGATTGAWPRLEHLGLSGLLVTQADVAALLLGAPATLRSAELSFLHFLDGGGSFRGLLGELRGPPGWRSRARPRPALSVGHALIVPRCGRAVWARREAVDGFLYGEGPNPFGGEGSFAPNQIVMGGGAGVERDAFDPSHERPYTDNISLMRLGVLKKAPWLE